MQDELGCLTGPCRMCKLRFAAGLFTGLALVASAQAQIGPIKPPAKSDKLPMSGLAPAKLLPDLCLYKYRVSTRSPECQAFFDQGLGFLYSYVWMEAARSFETAVKHDADCPMAWWGLSRALERWGKRDANKALEKANELKDRASHREQQLILARMQEKGLAPGVGDSEARKRAAIATLDNLLALYDDDEEAWYHRAQLGGGSGLFGGTAGSVPFYKALLRINPLHPGANHELVHYYEGSRRPALGWVYSENFIKSSPGIPHPWHMQSHLATRLGRWDKSSNSSTRAIELQRAYHREMNVKPTEDHQFSHHLEILMGSLIHDGRFREARALKKECEDYAFQHRLPWFRLHLAERDYLEALKVAEHFRKHDKNTAAYLAALVYLAQDNPARAAAEVQVLEEDLKNRKSDRQLQQRIWETRGLLLCHTGQAEAGLELIAKAVSQTKDDYHFHAWGNGAYFMEVWGLAALRCGKFEVAEEALLEALAHDSGSVRSAMGMQALCEKLGRESESKHFAELARRFWKHAEVLSFDQEWSIIRKSVPTAVTAAGAATTSSSQENGP